MAYTVALGLFLAVGREATGRIPDGKVSRFRYSFISSFVRSFVRLFVCLFVDLFIIFVCSLTYWSH